ncbi:MAG: hypothetical protein JW862_07535 [Anaerolineales bacterium]|nr:hypothetical protein [Anaerolineales bacterium]
MSITLPVMANLPLPAHLVGEIQSKLAYVDERILSATVSPAGEIRLVLKQPLQPQEEPVLVDKVQRVVELMAKGALKPKTQLLEDFSQRPLPYDQDPYPELLARRELHQEANGIYVIGPLLTRLIDYFEGIFLRLAAEFDAQPYRFPTLIPARYLERVNYFRAFPHSLSFVTHLRSDLDVIDAFAGQASCDEHGLNVPPDSFSAVQTLLSPAVCYHLYFALADKPLGREHLAVTAVGNCFRYESINLSSLERLWDFTMREVIFVGSKEHVLAQREQARLWMSQALAEIGLAYHVESATDPFFIGEFRKQAAFQSAFQLKFEIRARLPFKNSTLAVGSYNYHQDFFGRNLQITLPDGSPAHTGCVAFGLERMAFAFLAQFGFDLADWPAPVRQAMQG